MLRFLLQALPISLLISLALLLVGLIGVIVMVVAEFRTSMPPLFSTKTLVLFPVIMVSMWGSLFFIGLRQLDREAVCSVGDHIAAKLPDPPLNIETVVCSLVASVPLIPTPWRCRNEP